MEAAIDTDDQTLISIERVTTYVLRVPIAEPVITSFGEMNSRPAVLVRLEDSDGAVGWGEVWCNWPACGAEHRALLADTVFAPLLLNNTFLNPVDASQKLDELTQLMAIQTAEPGPFAQVLAGIDIALWDCWGRRQGKSIAKLLNPNAASEVLSYASGINLVGAEQTIARQRDQGYSHFKVKIGFGHDNDLPVVQRLSENLRPNEGLMLDVNQGWSTDQAIEGLALLAEISPDWVEEPLRADRSIGEWKKLQDTTAIPIAGGENLLGLESFNKAIEHRIFDVVQPDVAKWGGVSGCYRVAFSVRSAGLRYCPHYLGGGIGLVASAHLLAAVGGGGLLEVDVNPNPLQHCLAQPFPKIRNGSFPIPDTGGLGVEPDLDQVRDHVTKMAEISNKSSKPSP